MFQRRHYQWLAEFCRLERQTLPVAAPMSEAAIERLAHRLAEDNPRFQPDRFMRATRPAKPIRLAAE